MRGAPQRFGHHGLLRTLLYHLALRKRTPRQQAMPLTAIVDPAGQLVLLSNLFQPNFPTVPNAFL